jgi:hypothetical protein
MNKEKTMCAHVTIRSYWTRNITNGIYEQPKFVAFRNSDVRGSISEEGNCEWIFIACSLDEQGAEENIWTEEGKKCS